MHSTCSTKMAKELLHLSPIASLSLSLSLYTLCFLNPTILFFSLLTFHFALPPFASSEWTEATCCSSSNSCLSPSPCAIAATNGSCSYVCLFVMLDDLLSCVVVISLLLSTCWFSFCAVVCTSYGVMLPFGRCSFVVPGILALQDLCYFVLGVFVLCSW